MDRGRSLFRRLAASCFAVALAVGAVAVMRMVARELAGFGMTTSATQAVARVEVGANAPRVFDLATMVPDDLGYSVLGRACSRREIPLLMPRTLAIKVKENEAAAAGWKLLHQTGRYLKIYRDKTSMSVYETPTGQIVSRRFYGTGPDTSTMVEIELPEVRDLGMTFGGEGIEGMEPTIMELASVQSVAAKSRLPAVLREVTVGHPLFTVLERRGTGSVFNLTTIEMSLPQQVSRRIVRMLTKAGWSLADDQGRGMYVRENLTLGFCCDIDPEEPGATIVSYRISDDEVRVKPQRSEQ